MEVGLLLKNKHTTIKSKITGVGSEVEKLESLCFAGGNIKWSSH